MKRLNFTILFIFFCGVSIKLNAQPADPVNKEKIKLGNEVVISYRISIETAKTNGIAESYNGGLKTVFIKGCSARVRFVSLMRIQNLYWLPKKTDTTIAIVKESGKNKYKSYLTKELWQLHTKKYDSCTLRFYNDTVTILNFPCRKATVHLKDGRYLTVFFTDSIFSETYTQIEPVFAGIPGLVLYYEYFNKRGITKYTASAISFKPISPNVFFIPATGYQQKKYKTSPNSRNNKQGVPEREDE